LVGHAFAKLLAAKMMVGSFSAWRGCFSLLTDPSGNQRQQEERDGEALAQHLVLDDSPKGQPPFDLPCIRTPQAWGTRQISDPPDEESSPLAGPRNAQLFCSLTQNEQANLVRARSRLRNLPKAMAALRRFQRAIAEKALKRAADEAEVERGVLIERVFDFYDPSTGSCRLRKMNDVNIHTRKTVMRRTVVHSTAQTSGELASDSTRVPSHPSSPRGGTPQTRSRSNSVSSTPGLTPRDDGDDNQPRKRLAPNAFSSVVSMSAIEVIAVWGVMVGKLLNSRVLNFTCITDKALARRRLEVQADGKPFKFMQSVKARANMVVAQVKAFVNKVGKETIDMLDTEWRDDSVLSELFSSEYIDTLLLLTNAACKIISSQPILVRASAPCRIFGDTHGQLRDVLMLFHAFGMPKATGDVSFVFNGDFVDRGKHQLAVVGMLLALKVAMPDKIWLVRGNHEDSIMNAKYGFAAECYKHLGKDFGSKLLDMMHKVFDQLPLGCVVAERILAVHGGLGDARWSLAGLSAVRRPLTHEELMSEDNEWINAILWSDPIEDDDESPEGAVFGVHASPRGKVAKKFGWDVTKVFCARNGLSLVVRSHQSKKGSPGFDVMHDNLLMRVFSARDYEGQGNDGAVLFVQKCQEGEAAEKGMLSVRPQVLRSATKARNEVTARAAAESGSSEADTLGSPRSPRGMRSPRKESGAPSTGSPKTTPRTPRVGAGESTAGPRGTADTSQNSPRSPRVGRSADQQTTTPRKEPAAAPIAPNKPRPGRKSVRAR